MQLTIKDLDTLPPIKMAAILRGKMNVKLPDAIISATADYINSDYLISKDFPLIKKVNGGNLYLDFLLEENIPRYI